MEMRTTERKIRHYRMVGLTLEKTKYKAMECHVLQEQQVRDAERWACKKGERNTGHARNGGEGVKEDRSRSPLRTMWLFLCIQKPSENVL